MSFIPDAIRDKDKGESLFVKTDDLLKGVWTIVSMNIIESNNAKYGANEQDALFRNEVLAEGETVEYIFKNEADEEKKYNSKGLAFYLAFKNKDEELNPNDKVTFKKEGSGEDTRWEIEKV